MKQNQILLFSPLIVKLFQIEYQSRFLLKPEKYSPEFLLSNNYLSRSLIKKDTAIKHLPDLNNSLDFLYQEWDLLIRLCDHRYPIINIPYTMVYQVAKLQLNENQIKKVFEIPLYSFWFW